MFIPSSYWTFLVSHHPVESPETPTPSRAMQSHTTTASTADAGAAAGNVRAASAGAVARVQEMATIVKDYAVKYGEAAPEGQLLGAIKEDLLQAAEKVRRAHLVLRVCRRFPPRSQYSDKPKCARPHEKTLLQSAARATNL